MNCILSNLQADQEQSSHTRSLQQGLLGSAKKILSAKRWLQFHVSIKRITYASNLHLTPDAHLIAIISKSYSSAKYPERGEGETGLLPLEKVINIDT